MDRQGRLISGKNGGHCFGFALSAIFLKENTSLRHSRKLCIYSAIILLHFFFKTRLRYNYIDRLSLILYFLFSGVLQKWRHERQILAQKFLNQGPAYLSSSAPSLRGHSSLVCEHIVVMNKRDLVPEWGIEVSNITTFGDLILTYSSYPYVPLITFFYNINLQPSAVPTGH